MSTALARGTVAMMAVLAVATATPAQADSSEPLFDLVDAAAQRLQTADAVAANKWLTGGPITDPARVEQVLAAVSSDAESRGLATDYATTAFTNQINATEAIEYSRFAGWKFDPAGAPSSAPDLSASRSVIDGLNHQMVEQMAAQWALLNSPGCRSALDAAKNAVADQRQFDDLYRTALDVATRSYCPGD
ncbi:chorismate mutase [Mycobacterium sp. CVI_P3]|uniref:Chorismate mutase n=1 Tax=Mycobacterium pinniadriaticum TaxID=2994102 RepID=A0ABT3S9G3_9MYCO|nr:chorismate mutase [Mycobacterium pinniadriaticum]MCX2929588.1 chorismate mutase [Mycobacterium pinniadriaticum]MCX2936012.1 chorismate mutase [Mycobacterium pinniadriaticum]